MKLGSYTALKQSVRKMIRYCFSAESDDDLSHLIKEKLLAEECSCISACSGVDNGGYHFISVVFW